MDSAGSAGGYVITRKTTMKHHHIIVSVVCILSPTLLLACCQSEIIISYTIDTPSLHTEAQSGFLDSVSMDIFKYAQGDKEISFPNPVTLSWQTSGAGNDTSFLVRISEQEDMSDAKEYFATTNTLELYNLKIGTSYYCTVSTVCGDETVTGDVQQFTTPPEAPRNLFIEGVKNARDLGGWKTADGGSIRQGLLYRSATLSDENDAGEAFPLITAAGIETALSDLGIRTEVDFRTENGGITESVLGKEVQYLWCPMGSVNNYLRDHAELIRHIFEIFSNKENYPLIFHCRIGSDRTGMIAFLVEGLLGVPEDSLYRDYLFSNFSEIGSMRSISDTRSYTEILKAYHGNDLSEKIYNYLAEVIQVPREQLNSIIEILYQPSE